MHNIAEKYETLNIAHRAITQRTKGRQHGPITRLVSPGDLGELIKPFVFLDLFDIHASPGNIFGYHPHSGIVTVTVMFEGEAAYEDSTGKAGVLQANEVEWMQAGSGVWHMASTLKKTRQRGFQLWFALPPALENTAPESLYIPANQIPNVGPARVIIGEYQGVRSPLPHISPITYLHVHLKDGEQWTFDPPAQHDVLWVAVNEGSIDVANETLSSEIAIFETNSLPLTVQARGTVDFVLGSAIKHPYPLVMGNYSVHTSAEALRIGEEGIRKVGKSIGLI